MLRHFINLLSQSLRGWGRDMSSFNKLLGNPAESPQSALFLLWSFFEKP